MIFVENARKLWNLGLNIIPLEGKRPVIKSWQAYSARRVTDDELSDWERSFPNGNIGLVLGQSSGLVALDVDTDDPIVLSAINLVAPKSPWIRRGRKGYVVLFKYQGQQTFRIRREGSGGISGESICDFLSTGGQVVLPPSIHPDTQKPYTANCELADILANIGVLPQNFEGLLKDALAQVGIKTAMRGKVKMATWIPAGGRDNELVRRAGLLAYDVWKGNESLLKAMQTITAWQKDMVEHVWGDELQEGKGVEKLVECLRKDLFGARKRTLPGGWSEGLTQEELEKLNLGDLTDDQRRFGYQEIVDHFVERLEGAPQEGQPRTGYLMQVAENCVSRIAGNDSISRLEEDQLLRFMSQATGGGVSITALRKRVVDLRAGEITGTDHSELAKVVLEQLSREGEVRYWDGDLWRWTGANWSRLEDTLVLGLLAKEYGNYPAARKAPDHMGILKVLRVICTTPLKKNSLRGINFVNGFLTEDLNLVPHDPDYGCNYVLGYPYKANLAGKCTLWMQMLENYWGEDPDFAEKLEALQQAMAATLFGLASDYQRVICLYGVAFSGKSRVLEVMRGLMPEGCISVVPPGKWTDKYEVAEMAGKLLNVAGELSEKNLISGDIFKTVVDGTEMNGQFKYKTLFKFRMTGAHWFASNHPPKADDSSEGFTRRWLFLEFNKPLDPEKRILGFDQIILQEEREAIIAWAVQGLISLKAQRDYSLPPSHMKITEMVANATNTIRFFLVSLQQRRKILLGLEKHKGRSLTSTPTERVFSEYRVFCISQASVSPVSYHRFLACMRELQTHFGYRVAELEQISGVPSSVFQYLTLVEPKVA